MHPRATAAAFMTALFAVVSISPAAGADDARDFTGVWQAFASEPASSSGASTLSADGKVKVADFNARYPNSINPASYCVTAGMPAMIAADAGGSIEIMQNAARITMITSSGDHRRVFLDGRAFPENHRTTRTGYSIGHWEGNTLVVETGLVSEMLAGSLPRTENAVIVERISKSERDQVGLPAGGSGDSPPIDDKVLAFNLTITDSALYSKPQTITVYYQHLAEHQMPEDNCAADLWLEALEAANP